VAIQRRTLDAFLDEESRRSTRKGGTFRVLPFLLILVFSCIHIRRNDRFVAVEHLVTFLTERRAGRSTRGGRDEDADSPDSADTEAEHEC
jgi:hypothetical protein